MRKITRRGDHIVLELEPGEASFLRDLPALMRAVLAANHPSRDALLPRFSEDDAADRELRALLDDELVKRKIERCESFAGILADRVGLSPDSVELTTSEAEDWLALLTDLRLVLAAEVGIEDESWSAKLTTERRREAGVRTYLYLTGFQAALLEDGFGISYRPADATSNEPPDQPG